MRKISLDATLEGQQKTYNLDEIAESRRDSTSLQLNLQNWYWHPDADGDLEFHAFPNPPDLEVGQVWVSIRCNTLEELKSHYGGEK